MKKILIALISMLVLCSCQKQNELVGTTWNYFSDSPLEIILLTFHSESDGTMNSFTEGDFNFTYSFKKPIVTLMYEGREMSGSVSDNKMTFAGMGNNGSDMVFTKKQ